MRHNLSNYKNNKKIMIAGLVCLILVAVLGYFVFGGGKGGHKKAEQPLPKVSLYQVKRADMARHIVLSGQTVSDATIVLAPKYAGRVTAVNVQLGDQVAEGDVLVIQDTGDLDIAIKQGEAATKAASADAETEEASYNANLAKTAAAYEIQKSHYERQQYLYSIGAISQDTLDSARNTYVTSKAQYDALMDQNNGDSPASVRSKQFAAMKNAYSVDALRKQRNDMIIRAPRGGVIGYRDVEVGSFLSAGSKILTLIDNSHLYVDCSLSENDAALLSTGLPVSVTIDALGATYSGKIVYVSPGMGAGTKSYVARISLDIAKGDIKAGLFARTSVDILQRKDTLFAPKDAVLTKNGITTVFVYNHEDGTVEEREVKIGLINDEEVELLSGVKEGDEVVITNLDRMKNGGKVVLESAEDTGEGN